MDPLVSVCIPSYNNSKYIAETIQSVLSQTYSNFELIIVDDCSSDNTLEIVRGFKDRRIVVYQNEANLGMHGNWNKVLSLANGEYMKLLCGDDLIYPDCLAQQVNAFFNNSDKNISVVSVHRELISSTGKKSFGSFYKFRAGLYSGKKAVRGCVTFGTNLIGEPMAVLFKSSVFKEHKVVLESNNYTIDLDMYFKLLQYGSLLVLKDSLAAFRIYADSMSGSLGFKHYHQFNEFINEQYLAVAFGVKWYHRAIGGFITFNITILRNIIIFISNR
jgi:glycosyltransferase involved in cell wall biosynthesis